MNPVKFPINSREIFFIAMLVSIFAYCLGSLITYRKPYNLDKLLHRGIYNTEGKNAKRDPWTWRTVISKIIGITPEYTKGDRIIAWSIFYYSFVYGMGIYFFGVITSRCKTNVVDNVVGLSNFHVDWKKLIYLIHILCGLNFHPEDTSYIYFGVICIYKVFSSSKC